ncbi:hypothetical protein BH10BAC5_BH10BAC5_08860 [soil metagenome]
MVTIKSFRQLALSLPDSIELPHFEKSSFRVNKKIFATLDEHKTLACLMLTKNDQYVFSVFDNSIIYPVPNKWGLKGATFVELNKVGKKMLMDMIKLAYKKAAAKNPVKKK